MKNNNEKKILITGLGTGLRKEGGRPSYRYTIYELEGKFYYTNYLYRALLENKGYDKIIFIGTSTSGWSDLYHSILDLDNKNKINKDLEDKYIDLDEKQEGNLITEDYLNDNIKNDIEGHFKKEYSRDIDIGFSILELGKSQKEINRNISRLLKLSHEELLKAGSQVELDLDITHSLRSIPMLYYTMSQFAQTLARKGQMKLGSVFYGMFEASKGRHDKAIEKLDISLEGIKLSEEQALRLDKEMIRPAPVVDIKKIIEVSSWIKAIENFANFGYGEDIVNLLKTYSSLTNIDNGKGLENLAENIYETSQDILTNKINNLTQRLADLETSIKEIEREEYREDPFISTTIAILWDFINFFKYNRKSENNYILEVENDVILNKIGNKENLKNYKIQYITAKWYLLHNNYVSFIGLLYESFVTLLVEEDPYNFKTSINSESGGYGVRKELSDLYLKENEEINENCIPEFFKALRDYRNDMLHLYTSLRSERHYKKNVIKIRKKLFYDKNTDEIDYYKILNEYQKVVNCIL